MIPTARLLALTFAAALPAQTRDLAVVLPTRLTTVEGNSNTNVPFARSQPMRAMYAYGTNTPGTGRPLLISGIAVRLDGPRTTIAQSSWDLALDVSTTTRQPSALSQTFAANHGQDRVRVFDGIQPLAAASGLTGTPHEFLLQITFAQPFEWNPQCGALLLDFRVRNTTGGIVCDAATDGGEAFGRIYHTTDADAVSSEVSPERRALALQLILSTSAAPTTLRHVEGNAVTGIPWQTVGASNRVQYAYDASTWAFGDTRRITRLGWRLHNSVPYTSRTYDLRVTLSTGIPGLSTSLSTTFDDNHGPDATVVFDGVWTVPDLVVGSSTDPWPFGAQLPLSRAFDYDPRRGSLLVDIQLRNATGASVPLASFDAINQAGAGVGRVWAGDHAATTAEFGPQTVGLVMAANTLSTLGRFGLETVLPARLTDREGSSATSFPFDRASPMRVLFAHGADTVDQQTPMRITGVALRPDSTVTSFSGIWDLSVDVSTGVNPADALDTTFDANHGADRTRVYDSAPPLAANAVLPLPGPHGFLLRIPFAEPFDWDPACGPLLLDFRLRSTPRRGLTCDAIFSDGTETYGRIAHTTDADATVANLGPQRSMLVTQLILDTTVTPKAVAASSAGGFTNRTFAQGSNRSQFLYEGSTFGFAQPRRITRLGWRLISNSSYAGATYDLRVTLSRSSRTTQTHSAVFADNHGSEPVVVFDGEWTPLPVESSCGDATPFSVELPLQRPFIYDPQRGSLIVDLRVRNVTGTPSGLFARSTDPGVASVNNSDSSAQQGTVHASALALALGSTPIRALPADRGRTLGTTPTPIPWGLFGGTRSLSVYDPAVLDRGDPVIINGLSWRARFAAAAPLVAGPVAFPATVDLSTGLPASRTSLQFANNHGPDRVRAFDGTVSVTRGPVGRPDDFVITLKLDRPFRWDPSAGSLVVDIRKLPNLTRGWTVDVDAHAPGGTATISHISDPDATIAEGLTTLAPILQLAGPRCNARGIPYGSGCAGSSGTPNNSTRGLPVIPNYEFGFTLDNARRNSPAALFVGLSRTSTPLDFLGFTGCTLLSPGDIAVLPRTTDSVGKSVVPFAIGVLPTFDGAILTTQWAILDPSGSGGLALSYGIESGFCR